MTEPMRYTIVIKESLRSHAVHSPDSPRRVATGSSGSEAVRETREAIRFLTESLREHHQPVPEPRCAAAVVDVLSDNGRSTGPESGSSPDYALGSAPTSLLAPSNSEARH